MEQNRHIFSGMGRGNVSGGNGEAGRDAVPRPKRKQKKKPHPQPSLPERPIQDEPYAKKPDWDYQKAKNYLDWWIREFGSAHEVVTSAPWKVGSP